MTLSSPFFNPAIVYKELTSNQGRFIEWWTSKEEALKYVHEMCIGLTVLSTVCIISTAIAAVLALFGWLPVQFLLLLPLACVLCASYIISAYLGEARCMLSSEEIDAKVRAYFSQ